MDRSPPTSPPLSQGMDERKQGTPQAMQTFPFASQLTQARVAFSPDTPLAPRTRTSEGTPIHSMRSPSNSSSLRRSDLGRLNVNMVPSTPFSPSQTTENVVPPSQIFSRSLLRNHDQDHEDNNNDDFEAHELMLTDDGGMLNAGNAEVRIWGTDINVHHCASLFRHFLENYGRQRGETSPSSLYFQQLLEMKRKRHNRNSLMISSSSTSLSPMILNIYCQLFLEFIPTRSFYHQLIQYPQEIIPILDIVVNEEYKRLAESDDLAQGIPTSDCLMDDYVQVRLYGVQDVCRLRSLNPENIEQLIAVKGMVIRVSSVIPDLKQAFFRCSICNHTLQVGIERGRIEEPNSCPQCQTLASLEIIHNRCIFSDKQMIRLQETPDEIPEGETPQTITLFAFDDLVDSVRPGDRLEVTGIFRAIPRRSNPRLRTVRAVFKTYLDVIHFRRSGFHHEERMLMPDEEKEDDLAEEEERIASMFTDEEMEVEGPFTDRQSDQPNPNHHSFTRQRIQEFIRFSQSRNVEERLVKSFAPSIWEMDDVKKGLLCLLFGGTVRRKKSKHPRRGRRSQSSSEERKEEEGVEEEDDNDENDTHHRGDINILLCGDPGTSKSQLLSYVHKLTPRGIYTSGKGSSAVGLTASVVRDPETRDMVLESGALVLSDNGICCIDEFDKMSEQTRAILHEAMEQQTVSITKAGIIATLNARTSILASANPVQSRYNPRLSVVDNIKLPPTLLSRFDLIYLVLDKPNPETDRRLAKHLVSLYFADDDEEEEGSGGLLGTNKRQGGGDGLGGYDDNEGEGEGEGEGYDHQIEAVDQIFLKEYILYARHNIYPEISDEAEDLLITNYVQMRSLGHSGSSGGKGMKIITATPRQLESLIRLSQSLAKMHLSNTVTREHVQEATRLMKVATQTAATDPRTGTIDMDLISTGRTALNRDLIVKLSEEMRYIFTHCRIGDRFTLSQLRQRIQNQQATDYRYGGNRYQEDDILGSLTLPDIEDAARKLESDGVIQYLERTQTIIIRNLGNEAGEGGNGGGREESEDVKHRRQAVAMEEDEY